jgi:N-acetylglutamate synthase-like GNAT family acetyltransferase
MHPVRSPEDWRHLHNIRRAVLFVPERRSTRYDENHPDDRASGNVPFLLRLDGQPIGVVRLDLRGEVAMVRLVAIVASKQRKGHGRVLGALMETEARQRGVRTLRVNAAAEALGYYEKMGWRRAVWDKSELVGLAANCIQMIKEF